MAIPHANPITIVGIGSSAGGLEPTIEFFKRVSPDTGFAFVVIQHLQADILSQTAGILAEVTAMPVTAALDQELPRADHAYTMEPNTQLTIEGGRFQVRPRTEEPAHHKPFDRFLISLASDRRTRAIAVVLSGYDGDGSEGFVAIKAQGGTTYAQDHTALISDMPSHAIATGCVDHVMDAGRIAQHLSRRD